MTAPATSRAGGPGGSSSGASSTAAGTRDAVCRLAGQGPPGASTILGALATVRVPELHGLRADFLRKAVMAGTDQVCRPLLAAGASQAGLLAMTLGEVPGSAELD